MGFQFSHTTSLRGYLFARLEGCSHGTLVIEAVHETHRGDCSGESSGSRCRVLASQTLPLQGGEDKWQRLNVTLAGLNGSTSCANTSATGSAYVRCVGRFGGGPPGYFGANGKSQHPYEEGVCIVCSGSIRVRAVLPAGGAVLVDQFFLSPAAVFGSDVERLPARADVAEAMSQSWSALRFGGGTADGTTYRWRGWRGPRSLRPVMSNRAYPFHTNGFMAFETLELAERLGLNETVIDLNEHETSEDAADFIECVLCLTFFTV
jgi:hypothetical protein